MMRFSLKSLFRLMTAFSIFFAVSRTAGLLVTTALVPCLWIVWWAFRSKRHGWMLAVRSALGIVGLIASWFLAVDWSWFIWECSDCRAYRSYAEYRLVGIPLASDSERVESFFEIALNDLGVPCPHENTTCFHKHRFWGLILCKCPCWNGIMGLIGDDSRYTPTIAARVRKRGQTDPEFAAETYRQFVTEHNFRFFWDALMADEIVQDSLNVNSAKESIAWLSEATKSSLRWIGTSKKSDELLEFVQEIYEVGAVEVLAINIRHCPAIKIEDFIFPQDEYDYERMIADHKHYHHIEQLGGEAAECLAIKLPPAGNARVRVFAWEAIYQQTVNGNWPATPDYGQSFLLLDID